MTIGLIRKAAFSGAAFFSLFTLCQGPLFAQPLSDLDQQLTEIISRIAPLVVTVESRQVERRRPLAPAVNVTAYESVNAAVGSGVIIDSAGYILTVSGLVNDKNAQLTVSLGDTVFAARVVGVDNRFDLAVLHIDSTFSTWARLSELPLLTGRLSMAYGYSPGKTGYPSLGIVAGLRKDGRYLMSGAILPGSIGGGVFDLEGNLLGIISSGRAVADVPVAEIWGGIAFVPAKEALEAARRMICCGDQQAGYLGVRIIEIDLVSETGDYLGQGLFVSEVEKGSPAGQAGIEVGDVIVGVAGKKVTASDQLQHLIAEAGADEKIPLRIMRSQEQKQITVELTAMPPRAVTAVAPGGGHSKGTATPDQMIMMKRIDSIRSDINRLQRELDLMILQLSTNR
jgi:serine protease Do